MKSRSEELFEQASRRMPGGVNSPVRAFGAVGGRPFFVKKAKGPWLYDEDDRRYLDYVCSWGPCILGHAFPAVIEAVQKACEDGLTFGAPTRKEGILAELICSCVPVMSAVRVARGYTGREKIIKFEGNYHGHSDGLLVKAGSGMMTQSVPDSAGVPAGYAASTLTAVYNDTRSVQRLMEQNREEVAAVVVEPVAANMGVVPPKPGFLEFLRRITQENGALLIFDEVITGFRLGTGGATEYTGVRADLHTFGKIVGGGMPLAAYGGSREIMSCVAPLGPVYQAGTLSGNPVAVTAGIETLKILMDHPEIYQGLEEKAACLERAFQKKGLTVNRAGSLLTPFFTGGKKVENYGDALGCDREAFRAYFAWMLSQNIYVAPSPFEAMFVSNAHTEELIEQTCRAIEEWPAL